jgi:hypothetical protein
MVILPEGADRKVPVSTRGILSTFHYAKIRLHSAQVLWIEELHPRGQLFSSDGGMTLVREAFELFHTEASIARNTTHGERVYWIVARNRHNAMTMCLP